MKPTKEKMVATLRNGKITLWNRWRRINNNRFLNLSGCDLRYSDMSGCDLRGCDLSCSDLRYSDLRYSDMSGCDLRGCDLSCSNIDYSCLDFSCKSLYAKFDQKHIIQILYHAAMPCQNNKLHLDEDIKELLNSDIFKKVVNKFHRVYECGKFKGAQ